MECNKEEAIRVRDIAERKFGEGDLVGAKRFILIALRLYPCLDGAIQMSAVLDVHIAAQVEVGINEPEPDYYGILQVEPLSDDSTIKRQYRNLAKLVHPDKNKESMEEKARAAFQLIARALKVLSDEETRFQHDLRRGEEPTTEEPPTRPWAQPTPAPGAQASQAPSTSWAQPPPAPAAQASQAPSTSWAQPPPAPAAQASQAPNTSWAQPPPAPGAQASQAPNTSWAQPPPAPGAQAFQAPNTFWTPASPGTGTQAYQAPYIFWTACPFCRVQYQCLSTFLNCQVVCQNCHSSFPANGINVHPANWTSTFVWPPELLGNNNPFPIGSWLNMLLNKNHLAPAYGAPTNVTLRNDLLSIFSGANPYGRYGNNLPPALVWLGILLSALNLKL